MIAGEDRRPRQKARLPVLRSARGRCYSPPDMKTYDVLVLGGGSAGTTAARIAHQAGLRTAMFNDGELGGLCILRGCMPTKAMLHAAHLAHEIQHSPTPGVRAEGVTLDFDAIMANKDAKVARFKAAKLRGIEAGGYEVIDARATFKDEQTVEAAGELYRFERGAVIATGSVPVVPLIPGIDSVPTLNSDEVMRLTTQPESLIVLGSGAIGLELAQFFARIGTRVELVSRRPVFTDAGPEIAEEMERVLHAEPNLTLHQPRPPKAVRASTVGPGVEMELDDGTVLQGAALLLATGRAANVVGLGLEAAGVAVERGRVVHGADMRTSRPNIFVAGDATWDRQILHVANWEGAVAGRNLVDPGGNHRVETRLHVEAVFCDPPLATVGLNESAAAAAGHAVVTSLERFPETGRAITMDTQHGVSKLIADATTGELLGAQILGPRADDLIHTLATHMYFHGTAAQMLEIPWYHPTLSEVFLSQARAIEAARS